jgi:hypothetical protein
MLVIVSSFHSAGPALSHSMRQLETRLGVRLLNRTHSSLLPVKGAFELPLRNLTSRGRAPPRCRCSRKRKSYIHYIGIERDSAMDRGDLGQSFRPPSAATNLACAADAGSNLGKPLGQQFHRGIDEVVPQVSRFRH